MAIHKPKNSSKYHYRFMVNGTIHAGSTRTSNKAAACAYERNLKEKLYNEAYLDQPSENRIKLAALIKLYLKDMAHEKEYVNHNLYCGKLLGTKKDRKTKQLVSIHGLDSNLSFEKITDGDLVRLVQNRKKEGNGPSPILYELVVVSQLIKYANRHKYMTPAVNIAQIKKDTKLKPAKGRIRYLTAEEEHRLLTELQRDDLPGIELTKQQRDNTYQFVVLLLDIACRHTELASLQWKDVDLKRGQIRLYRSKVNNESMLTLTKRAAAILKQRHDAQDGNQYVFQREDGSHRQYAPKAFKTACMRAGLEDVSYHTLRHTACTKLVQAGLPLYAIQQIVGHATSTMTQRYSHLAPSDASSAAVDILNRLQQAI